MSSKDTVTRSFNHCQRIYMCKSERAAKKTAADISANLQTYRSASVYGINLREQVPARVNINDEIETTKFGQVFRDNYARHLVRAWVRNNRKTIIDAAYCVAIRKLKTELHVSTSAAKNILLQRSQNEYYEYQEKHDVRYDTAMGLTY